MTRYILTQEHGDEKTRVTSRFTTTDREKAERMASSNPRIELTTEEEPDDPSN